MRTSFVIALALAAGASASFSHVSVERTSIADGLQTFRFYANFTEPSDEIFGVFASDDLAMQFATTSPIINDGGAQAGTADEDFAGVPFTGLAEALGC